MKLKKTVHYYKFRDIMENPLLREKLLNKKTVAGVLSTISRYSTITRYTITRVDCTTIYLHILLYTKKLFFKSQFYMCNKFLRFFFLNRNYFLRYASWWCSFFHWYICFLINYILYRKNNPVSLKKVARLHWWIDKIKKSTCPRVIKWNKRNCGWKKKHIIFIIILNSSWFRMDTENFDIHRNTYLIFKMSLSTWLLLYWGHPFRIIRILRASRGYVKFEYGGCSVK